MWHFRDSIFPPDEVIGNDRNASSCTSAVDVPIPISGKDCELAKKHYTLPKYTCRELCASRTVGILKNILEVIRIDRLITILIIYLDFDLLRRLLGLDGERERDFLRDGDLLYHANKQNL